MRNKSQCVIKNIKPNCLLLSSIKQPLLFIICFYGKHDMYTKNSFFYVVYCRLVQISVVQLQVFPFRLTFAFAFDLNLHFACLSLKRNNLMSFHLVFAFTYAKLYNTSICLFSPKTDEYMELKALLLFVLLYCLNELRNSSQILKNRFLSQKNRIRSDFKDYV